MSYPVITPSAARGILEAILMKPIEKPEAKLAGFRSADVQSALSRICTPPQSFYIPLLDL